MGCRECKNTDLATKAGEISTVLVDYMSYFNNTRSLALTQKLMLTQDIFDMKLEEDCVEITSHKNDIKRVNREKIAQLAENISSAARIKRMKKKQDFHEFGTDEGKLWKVIKSEINHNSKE